MKTNQNKWLLGSLIITVGLTLLSYAQEGEPIAHKAAPTKLVETIPAPAYWLFQWPGQAVLNGPNRVDNDAAKVVWPKKQCLGWLKKVLAPSWLPPKEAKPIFISGEFDGRDVVRMGWEQNGYRVEVSQTASIFAIKLSPLGDQNTGRDPGGKVDNAKRLCSRIFKEKGYRWTVDGQKVPVKGLNQKIATYSFGTERIRHLKDDGAAWGRPQTAHEAGGRRPRNDEERRRERDPNNPDWDQSWVSYQYWFRRVNWWNDGSSVGFYFLKVEEGAWVPSYAGELDRRFFRVRGAH